jgi:hypothetical protein
MNAKMLLALEIIGEFSDLVYKIFYPEHPEFSIITKEYHIIHHIIILPLYNPEPYTSIVKWEICE